MKKWMAVVVVFLSLGILGGCMNNAQIEDRNYVMAMGLDYDETRQAYIVSMSFPDLKALTGEGESIHYPVMEIQGRNLKEVEDIYHQESSKRLDFGQLQTIIFGQTLLENPAAMEVMISYMKTHQVFTRTIYVCGARGQAADIVALDESVNGSIGFYIRDMFENNGADYGYNEMMLNDLIVARANAGDLRGAVVMPLLDTDGQMPYIRCETTFTFIGGQ